MHHIETDSALKTMIQSIHEYCQQHKNCSNSMVLLALLYQFGVGCKRDYTIAISYLENAILLNNPQAMCQLGEIIQFFTQWRKIFI
ncbi:Uncharacterised protein [Legionella wadsworthii]|uniref:Sel1 repeat n=1 Tax=Legionella wadsworthii TaxID=28088 RepID=A0A378LQS9_9GAMM|nr:sel1 repeat family protein [Legionella wadsworthii]STY29315.1 Uncharacterised protein [Legionella wadsworthii]